LLHKQGIGQSGALLLHERMSARELAGCAVMFAAIVLVQIPLPRNKKRNIKHTEQSR
jgi:drug/metabolite transporter (DMT)-like permease